MSFKVAKQIDKLHHDHNFSSTWSYDEKDHCYGSTYHHDTIIDLEVHNHSNGTRSICEKMQPFED